MGSNRQEQQCLKCHLDTTGTSTGCGCPTHSRFSTEWDLRVTLASTSHHVDGGRSPPTNLHLRLSGLRSSPLLSVFSTCRRGISPLPPHVGGCGLPSQLGSCCSISGVAFCTLSVWSSVTSWVGWGLLWADSSPPRPAALLFAPASAGEWSSFVSNHRAASGHRGLATRWCPTGAGPAPRPCSSSFLSSLSFVIPGGSPSAGPSPSPSSGLLLLFVLPVPAPLWGRPLAWRGPLLLCFPFPLPRPSPRPRSRLFCLWAVLVCVSRGGLPPSRLAGRAAAWGCGWLGAGGPGGWAALGDTMLCEWIDNANCAVPLAISQVLRV